MESKGHVHIIGVCGTAMASLAGLLKESGYRVTGSDSNAWPPMSTQLLALGISVMKGYEPAHLEPRPDFVVVGNVCRRDNPEAEAAIGRGIPYRSMPSFLEEHYLAGRHSVVIAGTHGKTTTTSMVAWMLEHAGRSPSFLVGGVPLNFGKSFGIGSGPHFVIEGDEYDTAFFDKGPKFLHYRPETAVITGVEFDHADIYRDFDHYQSAFKRFVSIIPRGGVLLAAEGGAVSGVIDGSGCRTVRYGPGAESGYSFGRVSLDGSGSSFDLMRDGKVLGRAVMRMPGMHNAWNATAALGVCLELGLTFGEASAGLAEFAGVARRQQARSTARGITIIDDFAHHPTAVAETIGAVRKKHLAGGGGRLIAVFEPRSNTSRRNFFQDRYAGAFTDADIAVVSAPFGASSLADGERLDHSKLCASIASAGTRAVPMTDVPSILEFLEGELKPGDAVLVMSNGAFDNLVARLEAMLGGPAVSGKG
jgi:UDP-N-acetylmuramate: L-alanyl-gamma-D-glutamyl-meso-diaminopimelate ligase